MRVLVRRAAAIGALLFLLCAAPAHAQQTHLLLVVGLGGDPMYTEQFHGWATSLIDSAMENYGVPADNITYLGEKVDIDPERIDERSTRENLDAAVAAIAERAGPTDHVAIVLFGHGTFTDGPKFNLPGRDPSAEDFAPMLDRLGRRRVTFVNTASASGPFVETLSGEGRVVMTATRNGRERNATRFGGYFVEAFGEGGDEADQDRDSRVSMLEAFTYARLKVLAEYETEGILRTEHALLDDNGDGEGTEEPDPLEGDGMLARTAFLTAGEVLAAERMPFADDPELAPLYAERTELEQRIDELRVLRSGADQAAYEAELERLLVELALKSRQIRQLEEAREGASDATDPR
ncbi:MAG: hypothetical protein F4W89_02525 [Acidobacteria bacterium]|nr:hypothetical protein [Acidobacteriota bacterium]